MVDTRTKGGPDRSPDVGQCPAQPLTPPNWARTGFGGSSGRPRLKAPAVRQFARPALELIVRSLHRRAHRPLRCDAPARCGGSGDERRDVVGYVGGRVRTRMLIPCRGQCGSADCRRACVYRGRVVCDAPARRGVFADERSLVALGAGTLGFSSHPRGDAAAGCRVSFR
jgi:hypothetical protein